MLITPSFSSDKGIDLDVYFTYDMYGVDHHILEYCVAKNMHSSKEWGSVCATNWLRPQLLDLSVRFSADSSPIKYRPPDCSKIARDKHEDLKSSNRGLILAKSDPDFVIFEISVHSPENRVISA